MNVCHVVNSADDTSIPAEIAAMQSEYTAIDCIGLLAWFSVDDFYQDDLIEVIDLDAPRNGVGMDRKTYRKAREVLKDYDVVHTHHNHSGMYGKMLGRRLGKGVVSTEHNTHDGFESQGTLVNGVTNPLANHLTTVSHAVRNSFAGWEDALLSRTDSSVIYNGVNFDRIDQATECDWDLSDELEVGEDSWIVINVGSHSEQKAQDTLVRAVEWANDRSDRTIELVLAGSGPNSDAIRRMIKREGHEHTHQIGFLETREMVYRLMDQADALAMPSRWEGYCVAAMEAMAHGTPCILSDIDVFREIYEDNALYHTVDSVPDLGGQIMKLCDNSDLQRVYGERARSLATEHAIENTVKEYHELYRQLV
jgi:glycosyltransferase involved in cell wall biosynthesis